MIKISRSRTTEDALLLELDAAEGENTLKLRQTLSQSFGKAVSV